MADRKRKVTNHGIRAGTHPSHPLCVLLADDNPDDRALVARELCKDIPDLEIIHVVDRKQLDAALDAARFDLVVTDFHLRWITGLDVLRLIKARNPQMPVIMFTGTATEEVAMEAMRLGLSDYVVKSPRHMLRLRRAVQNALAAADQTRARQRAEDQLADALEYIEDGFILFDEHDRLVVCNNQLRRMYPEMAEVLQPGNSFSDILRNGLQSDQFTLPEGGSKTWLRERVEAHKRAQGSIEQRLLDGRWVLIKERRARGGGYISLYTDITALKQRELELQRLLSEHIMLGAAVRQSSAGVIVVDTQVSGDHFPVIYINPAFEKITGFASTDVLGQDWRVIADIAVTTESARQRIRTAFKTHASEQIDIVNQRRNGEKFWSSLSISPVLDEDRKLKFYVGVLTDITERVRIRDMLEERTHMLDEAEHLAHLGHWRWDIGSDKLWWSEEIYQIRGLDPRNVDPDFNRTLSTYHPEDQPQVEKHVRGVAQSHESIEFEARIVRPDGEIRHVRVKGQYSPATADANETVFGIFQDITTEKKSEGALRRSERRYRRLMEAVPHGIKEIDVNGVITYANQAHHDMLGYARGELIGRKVLDLIAEDIRRAEAGRRFETLVSAGSPTQSFATRYRAADGRIMDIQVDAVISRDESGEVNGVISVATDITERIQGEKRLRYLAYYDPLTGLANRTLLNENLREQISQRGQDDSVAVVLFNVDGFKLINDALGHDAGDSVLREFGARLAKTFGSHDGVARLAADEFAVIITGKFGRDELWERVQTAKLQLEQPLQVAGSRLDVRLSAGVAVAPRDGEEAETILRNADSALLETKRDDPGGTRFYSAEMKALVEEFLNLRGRLRSAALQGEFFLEYQPQVELSTRRIVGLEALARWRTEDGVLIPPSKFITVAEQSGDIVVLGALLLEIACNQAMKWYGTGIEPTLMTVNISARQFLQEDLVTTVRAILERTGFDPRLLQLELTETAIMTDNPSVMQRMRDLNALGIRFSLDDFGTGYSSLTYLSRFPIDTLKIDRSFVIGMPTDVRHVAIVSALVAMSHKLDIRVVAEGVEEMQQEHYLRDSGCDLAQGFYYSYPLSADACASALREGVIKRRSRR
ncbi:MAG TPA: EAL domain-containing protein [Gammaproteobacteria bacterium]|nr:EAL domain-containing protein [Gammaproteobacteria bacterium]